MTTGNVAYTTRDLALETGVPEPTLYDWCQKRRVPHVRTGGRIGFTRAQALLLRATLGAYGRRAVTEGIVLAATN